MSTLARINRHLRLMRQTYQPADSPGTPPFLILFINSICNQTCEHCFYWRNLNQPDDLSVDELAQLSASLGRVDNLNLSGGEPFLRRELADICRLFIRNNQTGKIYVPTNGSMTDRTIRAIEQVLEEPTLELFAVELSLDGLPAFHDAFRGMNGAFDRAMATYDALAALQQRDARLRIHAISTATDTNIDNLRTLTTFLYERCPAMDHHNLALIRGDRKNAALRGPALDAYAALYQYMRRLWAPREEVRLGSSVEPMLQWAKMRTAEEQRQVVPCQAGILTGVVYANGDVAVCETHPPVGNLRQRSFRDIWNSEAAQAVRRSIASKACHCTNEMFLWPSITYRPGQLLKVMMQAKPWTKPEPLSALPPSA